MVAAGTGAGVGVNAGAGVCTTGSAGGGVSVCEDTEEEVAAKVDALDRT